MVNPFPNNSWFLQVCNKSLLKTLWEKEKLLITSNFSFFHSVFYNFGELSASFIKLRIVVCKLFQFDRVQNLLFGKGLNQGWTLGVTCVPEATKTFDGTKNQNFTVRCPSFCLINILWQLHKSNCLSLLKLKTNRMIFPYLPLFKINKAVVQGQHVEPV